MNDQTSGKKKQPAAEKASAKSTAKTSAKKKSVKAAKKPAGRAVTDALDQGAMVVDHPNAVAVRHELDFDAGKWRYCLIVVTDLPLNPKHPDHKTSEIDGLVRAVVASAQSAGIGYDVLSIRNS
ncbi:hypothetical protein KAJ83_00975 [Marivibrio halodurans]|uniref:Uncharacterized protein n=1 Tax=Marivibrio halodurans TaxID=2039722 RepID=A0A8J7S2L9_9PROT|nr:hypothetical protein [Marivibrio halodurans]MBP5855564.1 hypothetical protein [Marivibrio halodurans]